MLCSFMDNVLFGTKAILATAVLCKEILRMTSVSIGYLQSTEIDCGKELPKELEDLPKYLQDDVDAGRYTVRFI